MSAMLVFTLIRSASRVWQDIQRTTSSAKWPSIIGQITGVIDPDSSLLRNYNSDAIIAFKYAVHGQEYTGTTISFSRRKKWYYNQIKAFIIPFQSHPQVQIFYDPQEPWIAVLQPGGSNSDNIWFFAGQCVAILVISLYLIFIILTAYKKLKHYLSKTKALRQKKCQSRMTLD